MRFRILDCRFHILKHVFNPLHNDLTLIDPFLMEDSAEGSRKNQRKPINAEEVNRIGQIPAPPLGRGESKR